MPQPRISNQPHSGILTPTHPAAQRAPPVLDVAGSNPETVNVEIRVYDKTTGNILLDEPLSTVIEWPAQSESRRGFGLCGPSRRSPWRGNRFGVRSMIVWHDPFLSEESYND